MLGNGRVLEVRPYAGRTGAIVRLEPGCDQCQQDRDTQSKYSTVIWSCNAKRNEHEGTTAVQHRDAKDIMAVAQERREQRRVAESELLARVQKCSSGKDKSCHILDGTAVVVRTSCVS